MMRSCHLLQDGVRSTVTSSGDPPSLQDWPSVEIFRKVWAALSVTSSAFSQLHCVKICIRQFRSNCGAVETIGGREVLRKGEQASRYREICQWPHPPLVTFCEEIANTVQLVGRKSRDTEMKCFNTREVLARSNLAVPKTDAETHVPSWMPGSNQAWLFTSGTSTVTNVFERGRREGINKTDTCRYLRMICKEGQLKDALHILNWEDISVDCTTYVCLLQECIKLKGLAEGKQVHAHIIQSRFKPNILLFNTLLNMYAKCGSMVDARLAFDKMAVRDVFTWTTMMAGYAKHGCSKEALEIFQQMIWEGVRPNKVTFVCILNVCASLTALEMGKEVHGDIIKAGIVPNIILETALVNMYAKCGSIREAWQVFDNMAERNVVSWSTMIAGYAQQGCGREAFDMYKQMIQERVMPNRVLFTCVLTACASLAALEKGKEVHGDIIAAGIVKDIILETALVDMYAKCGSMTDARQVFDNMDRRSVVSWNAMMAGYAQFGSSREAFETYKQMVREGVMPNQVSFTCILNACASLAALDKGEEVHVDIIKAQIVPDIILWNALVDMYAKCGSLQNAHKLFNKMAERNVASWNAIIAGYGHHGCGREALQRFEEMQQDGFKPNGITFICVLSACSHVGLVEEGRHYFDCMTQDYGLAPTAEHFGCMVDLFGRAGRLDEAEDLIHKMPIEPDGAVWGALLGACRTHGNIEIAERVAKFSAQDPASL